jgi:hypothetical protein
MNPLGIVIAPDRQCTSALLLSTSSPVNTVEFRPKMSKCESTPSEESWSKIDSQLFFDKRRSKLNELTYSLFL